MNENDTKQKRVVVAMSGGVDSSVSAALLKDHGYDVIGVSMQLYDPVPREPGCRMKTCCSLDDVLDAGRVAKKLGIPFEVIDMRAEFKQMVIDYFIAEYTAGRTPNPCIRCNDLIKFDALLRKAQEMEADLLATGHYARIGVDECGNRRLFTGLDPAKERIFSFRSANHRWDPKNQRPEFSSWLSAEPLFFGGFQKRNHALFEGNIIFLSMASF